FPSTAGRLALQAVPSRIISGLSPLPAYAVRCSVCIRPSCTSWSERLSRTVSGRRLDCAPPWRVITPPPRGPRSGSSYAVSDRHHLIDPIRPARRHTAISPHGDRGSKHRRRIPRGGEASDANLVVTSKCVSLIRTVTSPHGLLEPAARQTSNGDMRRFPQAPLLPFCYPIRRDEAKRAGTAARL